MTRLIYIHQYFRTPGQGGAIRSYLISGYLAKKNIIVEMITSHNKPFYEKKFIDDIIVHYLPVTYHNEFGFLKRIRSFLLFIFKSIALINKLQRPDKIYATSTPLSIGIIALWYRWRHKIPYTFEVRDLWPEAPVQMRYIRSGIFIWLSRMLERSIYHKADTLIALSPGIKAGIQKRTPGKNIHMIPNMSDCQYFQDAFHPGMRSEVFTITYSGSLGVSSGIDHLINIARSCKEHAVEVRFIVVGDGTEKASVIRQKEIHCLDNLEILPYQNKYEIREILKQTDAVITTFAGYPVLETNSPNKFFDGLAAGKLSIVNMRGWLKDLVEQQKCGFYTDIHQPEDFPNQIMPFMKDPELLQTFKENARKLALQEFDSVNLLREVYDLVIRPGQ